MDYSFDELFAGKTIKPVTQSVSGKKRAENKSAQKTGDTHHPACKTETPHRHEKAYVVNSAGGEITEGCEEHYFDRIVSLDEPETENSIDPKLAEYFVMGEILMNPKFKNGNNRRW